MRKILGAVTAVVLIAVLAVAYVWGPTYTAKLNGQARFFGTDTPARYAQTALELTDHGVYADTERYAAARAAVEDAAKGASSREELYPLIHEAARAAGGRHSGLLRPGAEASRDASPAAPAQAEVTRDGGVALATVPAISRNMDGKSYAEALAGGLADARDGGACGAIVDLRGNYGGDPRPMMEGLSPLLPEGPVIWWDSTFDREPLEVAGNSAGKWDAPVAVLVDGATASAGELAMMAFRGLERSQSFGAPTSGLASSNAIFDFPDGSALVITDGYFVARTGETFEYVSVPPDVDARLSETLPAAKRWLAEEHGCS